MGPLSLWNAGIETSAEGFARDQAMMTVVADAGLPLARLWRRDRPALCLGRFHRRPAPAPGALERRWSGGRAVVLGPGIAAMTLVLPSVDGLGSGGEALRPDQVLNRALRPLLAALTAVGLAPFYAGRDLITAGGRTVAHASFSVAADGVCIVEQHVAIDTSFAELGRLLAEHDPEGVSVVDRDSFEPAASIGELATRQGPDAWEQTWSQEIVRAWNAGMGDLESWRSGVSLHLADRTAHEAFLAERGPLADDESSEVERTMLGAVEASARLCDGRLNGLLISGDIIAPFHTLDEISAGLEGKRPEPAVVRRVMTSVMSTPRNFILGTTELDGLIARLA